MEEGLNLAVVVAVAVALVAWNVVSQRAQRWNVSAPMAFVAFGFLVANEPLSLVDVRLGGAGLRELSEIALAIVLFGDAAQVRVRELRADAMLPARLLGLGLPITIGLGTLGAHLLLPGLSWWVCAVIGAAVAPTDAALGAAIIEDERVPERIRRVLNVESGLNDGIATPFVSMFIVAAVAGTVAESESEGHALLGLLLGVLGGIVVGGAGAWLLAHSRTAPGATSRVVAVAALAVASYAAVVEMGGNGFVAAFVAGLAYGAVTPPEDRKASLEFTHQGGTVLSSAVWFLFGAVMVPSLDAVTWREVVFAVSALTVLRMAPVALSLVGMGFDRSTVGVIGWFGPRGLASVVFALLAFEELVPADGSRVVAAVTTTVVMSVVLHGVTAAPLSQRYAASHPQT